jgi:hypothetical protein
MYIYCRIKFNKLRTSILKDFDSISLVLKRYRIALLAGHVHYSFSGRSAGLGPFHSRSGSFDRVGYMHTRFKIQIVPATLTDFFIDSLNRYHINMYISVLPHIAVMRIRIRS